MTTISSAVAAQPVFSEEPFTTQKVKDGAPPEVNVCEAFDASRAPVPELAVHAHDDGPTFSPAQLMHKSKKSKKDGGSR